MSNYSGWLLFDSIIMVASDCRREDGSLPNDVPAYVVDPNNKGMLNTAIQNATISRYRTDENGERVHETQQPLQFVYENLNFILEINRATPANKSYGSDYCGCRVIAPDGNSFLVDIDIYSLFSILKQHVCVNGRIETPLMFAHRGGYLKMIQHGSPDFEEAVQDMRIRSEKSSCKTSKHRIGEVYETLTEQNIYLGKTYRWYEPITDSSSPRYRIVGYRKLTTPQEKVYFPSYDSKKTKLSDYSNGYWYGSIRKTAPARKPAGITIEMDIPMQTLYDNIMMRNLSHTYHDHELIGISDNGKSYTLPDNIRRMIIDKGYQIFD